MSSKDRNYSPCCLARGWVFSSSLCVTICIMTVSLQLSLPTEREKAKTRETSWQLSKKKHDYLHQGNITPTIAMQAALYFHCFKCKKNPKKLLSLIIVRIITSHCITSDLKMIPCARKKALRLDCTCHIWTTLAFFFLRGNKESFGTDCGNQWDFHTV